MPIHANPRHILLPDRKALGNANAQQIEKFSRAVGNGPVCTGATGTPGTLPGAGTLETVTWTPNSNTLYDLYGILANAPTTTPRIPVDGFYDLWGVIGHDSAAGVLELRVNLATTSNTGFGTPVFNLIPPFVVTKTCSAGIDTRLIYLFRGIELHADDLLQFKMRVIAGAAFTATTILDAEIRFVYPIPGDK